MNKKETVLVAMSGGVDSSVAAAVLLVQGYNVIGLTISTHKFEDDCRPVENKKSCCSYTGSSDAAIVCSILGVEHHMIDLTKEFNDNVVQNFVEQYLSGKTPNPCIECNTHIKWGPFLTKANEYGAKYLATGHYADIHRNDQNGRYYIRKSEDNLKDQSYALWGLSQEQLSRTLFPLEGMNKTEVRELAKKYNLPVFNKVESQDICFIPNGDYHSFLRKKVENIDDLVGSGDIVLEGKKIGEHKGFPFYTVGQRKGLGVSHSEPLYVTKIDASSNRIEVAIEEDTFADGLIADSLNFMKYNEIDPNNTFIVKIRYNDRGKPARCRINESGKLIVEFIERRRAVTPGQSVVVYDGDDLVVGGFIEEELRY